jgi:hypothetical protein
MLIAGQRNIQIPLECPRCEKIMYTRPIMISETLKIEITVWVTIFLELSTRASGHLPDSMPFFKRHTAI